MELKLLIGVGLRTPLPLVKPSKGLMVTEHIRPFLSEAPLEVRRLISGLARRAEMQVLDLPIA